MTIGSGIMAPLTSPAIFGLRKGLAGGNRGYLGRSENSNPDTGHGLDQQSRRRLLQDLRDEADRKAREIAEAVDYERWDGLA